MAVMQELAAQYPRYGYRRIQVFLARRGHAMSTDRAHRLWRLHRAASAEKKASAACGSQPPTAVAGNGRGPGLGV